MPAGLRPRTPWAAIWMISTFPYGTTLWPPSTALRPRLIVNCAAAADVDRCETDRGYADRGNILAPKHLAEAAAAVDAKLVHISTVFVFAGDQDHPYRETDEPRPLNYYGRSKLEGERLVSAALPDALIVRTSWMYGLSGIHFPGKVHAVGRSAADRCE